MELHHLHTARDLLAKYENKVWQQVIPEGKFPELLCFHENVEYIRKVLAETVENTGHGEDYVDVECMPKDANFFRYQTEVNGPDSNVASHNVIEKYIDDNGKDYRFETEVHPIAELQDRKVDNTTIGR